MQLKLETELFVVDVVIASEIEQSVVEVSESFLKVAHEEVGNALLEVGHSQVLIELDSALIAVDLVKMSVLLLNTIRFTYGLSVLSERGVNDAAVEEYLGGVRDGIEAVQ